MIKLLEPSKLLWCLSKSACHKAALPATSLYAAHNSQARRSYCAAQSAAPKKQNLLSFPAMPLEECLPRFLASVEPLLTPEEFKEQVALTKEFERGEGANLQALLQEEAQKSSNWLAPRWLKVAYLQYRDPVTVYSSPGMTFPLQKFNNVDDYVNYTAKVIYGLGEFKRMVDQDKIPIVKMGKLELDNGQFGKVFGTCRQPKRLTDNLIFNPDSKHVVVLHKNHFYKLPIFTKDCQLINADLIAKQLAGILKCESEFGPAYGLLTTDTRDNWAEAYEHSMKLPGNKSSIEIIESSLFTVSLDQNVEVDECERDNVLAAQLIHGGGFEQNSANRWMDKTIQLIANPNGMIGFTYEHSPAEGQPIAMMMDYVVKRMATDEEFGSKGVAEGYEEGHKLPMAPLSDCLLNWMHTARRNVDQLAYNLELSILKYDDYGKDFIKRQKLGPDSYVQMAIQLAFYMFYRVPGAQYESAHLRIYDGGRTETIRSCSKESLEFCKSMVNKDCTDELRAELLKLAVNGHQAYTKLALQGRGVDRHLLGLKLMALENCLPVPKFYSSPGFVKSTQFRVSTSQVASIYDAFMAYGPLVPNGYGCCYNPRECEITFAVSAWRNNQETSAKKFTEYLRLALESMKKTLVSKNQNEKAKL